MPDNTHPQNVSTHENTSSYVQNCQNATVWTDEAQGHGTKDGDAWETAGSRSRDTFREALSAKPGDLWLPEGM